MFCPTFTIISERRDFTVENKYSSEALAKLRCAVRPFMSEKRYAHTLAVETEAEYIARFVLPEKTGMLRAAALLHDVAKELSSEKQLNYIKCFDIISGDGDDVPPAVMHAAAALGAVREFFPEYADTEILSAVRFHTTGRYGMTLFDTVIFVADYTEATRKYETCRVCREFLHAGLKTAPDRETAVRVLAEATLMSIRQTVAHVKEKGTPLDPFTLDAERFFAEGSLPL